MGLNLHFYSYYIFIVCSANVHESANFNRTGGGSNRNIKKGLIRFIFLW